MRKTKQTLMSHPVWKSVINSVVVCVCTCMLNTIIIISSAVQFVELNCLTCFILQNCMACYYLIFSLLLGRSSCCQV